jgi:hypothetical protein
LGQQQVACSWFLGLFRKVLFKKHFRMAEFGGVTPLSNLPID